MGGFFGTVCGHDAISDVFFGTDYHSHLGTRRGGMAAYDPSIGLQREIHNIENSPFRTKFEDIFDEMQGTSCHRLASATPTPSPCSSAPTWAPMPSASSASSTTPMPLSSST